MKLLVVEDNSAVRNLLRMSFEAEGYAVDDVADGEQGSYYARVNTYDCILLDNQLPCKNGKEVCEDIRNANVSTPIIFLSALNEVTEKVACFLNGADDYVTKPFSFEELKSRLNAVLRRPKQIKAISYSLGDITLLPDSHEIFRKDTALSLTRKEYSILTVLIDKKGGVATRGEILEKVWDMNLDPFSNTLETHILRLRKKIGDSKKKQIIKNVSGRGYQINPRFFK